MFSHFGYEYVTQYTIPGRTQEGIPKPKASSLISGLRDSTTKVKPICAARTLPPQIDLVLRLHHTGIPRQRQLRLVVLIQRLH
jgi:hypothetical protein